MTEIFGTLGPACSDENIMIRMFKNGLTGMRLNLSHTSLESSSDLIGKYHRAAEAAGIKAELLIDLQGPELRIGKLIQPVRLSAGTMAELWEELPDGAGDEPLAASAEAAAAAAELPEDSDAFIPVPEGFLQHLDDGDILLLDDGKIAMEVIRLDLEHACCEVLRGGLLESRKSIKIVDKNVYGPALTAQDRINLTHAREYGVTAVMQPFVRNAADLLEVRRALLDNDLLDLRIFAKIESRQGIDNLEDIMHAADMVVIARGDLGNDMPLWELPAAQKKIEAICRREHKPFLVVTQLLTSMIHSEVPTRAEVSDIFNAVADGASAVMVTNETAVGEFPAEVIRYLANTAAAARKWLEEKEQ